ncbi:MAG: phosphatidic acid phosphatase [Oscillospiraceae bacterium]|nr:phosphatidic acid phosphatase [Oscillospiraceae bacterium]
MKTPVVNYKNFRLSKINTPEFFHLKLLLGWVAYFVLYFLTENLIPQEMCHIIHSPLDDIIPFCELFLIPYVFWYFLIVISLLFFLFYNVQNFKRLQTYIMITQVVAMAVYIIYPNCQNLRPEVFPRDNFLTDVMGFIYSIDTNTGVCPSLHCAYSIAMASVWMREERVSKMLRALIALVAVVICLSTVFVKQHSVVDFFAAIPVCILAEIIVFKVLKL